MKTITQITILLCTLWFITISNCHAQWIQTGSDIDGEFAGDASGRSVSISSDGTIVAIGAPSNSDGQLNTFFGHVRVFELNASNWIQKGNDIDGEAIGDFSGNPVSLNDNGTVVAIGAFNNDNANGIDSGHVRIYEFNTGNWVQKGSDIDGEAEGDLSGSAISINSNGTMVAIGAANNGGNGIASGHVRVYEFSTGNWIQKGKDIDGESMFDNSGTSVSLNDAGNIVAIGAVRNDGNGSNSGHVRVYEFSSGNWIQKGNDIDGEAANDLSGNSISLNDAGSIIAIGSVNNDGNGTDSGHVRIYQFNTGNWTKKGSDIDGVFAGDRSGSSVSLNANGNNVAIGSDANGGNGALAGHVRIYGFNGGDWVQMGTSINGEASLDRSGSSVCLNNNGNVVAIGAPFNGGNSSNSGHVRVFSNPTLGIRSSFLEAHITIFPNPTHDLLAIKDEQKKIEAIELISATGQVIMKQKLHSDTISLSELSNGIYFLKLYGKQSSMTKKIIKI